MKQLCNLVILCLVSAYVALLPQFYAVYNRETRYSLEWSPQIRASIWMAIGILAAIYAIIYGSFYITAHYANRKQARVNCERIVFNAAIWVMGLLIVRSVISIAYRTGLMPDTITGIVDASKWIIYGFLPIGLLIFWRKGYERLILNIYRLMTVMFVLFCVQSLWWNVASGDTNYTVSSSCTGNKNDDNSIYILMFDTWSYEATYGNPLFSITNMPHLQEFQEHAFLFREAYSPGIKTEVSIPRFLYQADKRIHTFSYDELLKLVENNRLADLGMESIFDLSANHFKILVGSIIHYPSIVGERLDYMRNIYYSGAMYTLTDRVCSLLHSQLSFLAKIGLKQLGKTISNQEQWNHKVANTQLRIRMVVNEVLPKLPRRNIVYFHFFLPKEPFLLKRDWTLRDTPDYGGMTDHTPTASYMEKYLENVYAMDMVIGDIIHHLKLRGEYDSSLIVILSDHSLERGKTLSWAVRDQDTYGPEKHIPMLIKYPNQVRGGDVSDPIVATELHPLFKLYLNNPDTVAQWVSNWNAGETQWTTLSCE